MFSVEGVGGFVLPMSADYAIDRVWDRAADREPGAQNPEYSGRRGKIHQLSQDSRVGTLFGITAGVAAAVATGLVFPLALSASFAGAASIGAWMWGGISAANAAREAAALGMTNLQEETVVGMTQIAPRTTATKNWCIRKVDALFQRVFSAEKVTALKSVLGAVGMELKEEDYAYTLRDKVAPLVRDSDALSADERERLQRTIKESHLATKRIADLSTKVNTCLANANDGFLGRSARRLARGMKDQAEVSRVEETTRKEDPKLRELQVKVLHARQLELDRTQRSSRIETVAKAGMKAAMLAGFMGTFGWASLAPVVFTATAITAVHATHVGLSSLRAYRSGEAAQAA